MSETAVSNEINLLKKNTSKREVIFDYLRGIAVFLMILAHVIHFFHDGSNQNLRFWEGVGNTLCFSIFLFISGAVTGIGYTKTYFNEKIYYKKSIKRILTILIGYYIVAFTASFPLFTKDLWMKQVLNILIWKMVPGFTEFIVATVIFNLLAIIFKKGLSFISKRFFRAITVSILMFSIGTVLFTIYVPEPFNFWKALFVGSEGLYRFPIFQYFPTFAMGLWWGAYTQRERTLIIREKASFIMGMAFTILFALTYLLSIFYKIPFIDPLNRWPPSIGFLAIGLASVFFADGFLKNLSKVKILEPFNRFLAYIGQDAFDMFVFSTLILIVYEKLWGQKYDSVELVLVLFFVVLALTVLSSAVNSLNSPSLFRKDFDIFTPYQRLFKKRYLVLSICMLILIFFNLKIPTYADIAGTVVKVKDYGKNEPIGSLENLNWWNDEYGQFMQISVTNNEKLKSINIGEVIKVEIDHKNLVSLGLSTENGDDLTIVYYAENNAYEHEILETTVINPNQTNTQILFKAVNRIFPQSVDNRYFLFHENILVGNSRNIFSNPTDIKHGQLSTSNRDLNYTSTLSEDVKNKITTSLSKTWIIKDEHTTQKLKLTANVNDVNLDVEKISYYIVNDKFKDEMTELYPLVYEAEIDASNLKPGGYEVYAIVSAKSNEIWSQKARFIVSEPIYVAWTLDWEGYNENPDYLDEIDRIASSHNIRLTHFFNPRIYITDKVTAEQREYMTNWVKTRREKYADAIGMHLHMHKDMVTAAGVLPKDSPRWGKYNDADGQDVMTTEYSYEELQKIVQWGMNQFEENGLGTPKLYRAGGWFADMDLLRVLEENSFWLDSSGRKRDSWWSNFPYWNLSSTTQPYLISKEDQNKSTAPTLNLWEFPNNGGDTTAFEATALIQKFKDNYSGGFADDKKLITYLSHPRFWETDRAKVNLVLEYLEDYKYENNDGPVVFITLNDAYQIWK